MSIYIMWGTMVWNMSGTLKHVIHIHYVGYYSPKHEWYPQTCYTHTLCGILLSQTWVEPSNMLYTISMWDISIPNRSGTLKHVIHIHYVGYYSPKHEWIPLIYTFLIWSQIWVGHVHYVEHTDMLVSQTTGWRTPDIAKQEILYIATFLLPWLPFLPGDVDSNWLAKCKA